MSEIWKAKCFIEAEDAAENAVEMEVAVGLPFVPAVGMLLAVTAGGDYFRVDQVYWHVDDRERLDVFLESVSADRVEKEDYLVAQGWQRSGD